tara:strand:- start:2439 stop:4043 length:1605 start_codon:yes stop_codon:yes gene_type:complete
MNGTAFPTSMPYDVCRQEILQKLSGTADFSLTFRRIQWQQTEQQQMFGSFFTNKQKASTPTPEKGKSKNSVHKKSHMVQPTLSFGGNTPSPAQTGNNTRQTPSPTVSSGTRHRNGYVKGSLNSKGSGPRQTGNRSTMIGFVPEAQRQHHQLNQGIEMRDTTHLGVGGSPRTPKTVQQLEILKKEMGMGQKTGRELCWVCEQHVSANGLPANVANNQQAVTPFCSFVDPSTCGVNTTTSRDLVHVLTQHVRSDFHEAVVDQIAQRQLQQNSGKPCAAARRLNVFSASKDEQLKNIFTLAISTLQDPEVHSMTSIERQCQLASSLGVDIGKQSHSRKTIGEALLNTISNIADQDFYNWLQSPHPLLGVRAPCGGSADIVTLKASGKKYLVTSMKVLDDQGKGRVLFNDNQEVPAQIPGAHAAAGGRGQYLMLSGNADPVEPLGGEDKHTDANYRANPRGFAAKGVWDEKGDFPSGMHQMSSLALDGAGSNIGEFNGLVLYIHSDAGLNDPKMVVTWDFAHQLEVLLGYFVKLVNAT